MLFHQSTTFNDRLSILAYLQSVNKLMVFVYVDLHFLCLPEKITHTGPLLIDHFTVPCLVAWPLNESEACFDRNLYAFVMLMMLFPCKLVSIYIRKALRILSKQGYLQPYFHSKARQLKWSVISCATGIPIVSCDVVVEVASDITVRTYMPAELIV